MKKIKLVEESRAAEEADPTVIPVEGIKMKSPDGTVYYVTVSDTGDVITAEVV